MTTVDRDALNGLRSYQNLWESIKEKYFELRVDLCPQTKIKT